MSGITPDRPSAGRSADKTAGRTRAKIGFDEISDDTVERADPVGFDPAEWAPAERQRPRPETAATRAAATATGFRSREAPLTAGPNGAGGAVPVIAAAPVEAMLVRRRRTGRNTQFNLKARPETIADFCAVADAHGWGLGETLEFAVTLLQKEYGPKGQG